MATLKAAIGGGLVGDVRDAVAVEGLECVARRLDGDDEAYRRLGAAVLVLSVNFRVTAISEDLVEQVRQALIAEGFQSQFARGLSAHAAVSSVIVLSVGVDGASLTLPSTSAPELDDEDGSAAGIVIAVCVGVLCVPCLACLFWAVGRVGGQGKMSTLLSGVQTTPVESMSPRCLSSPKSGNSRVGGSNGVEAEHWEAPPSPADRRLRFAASQGEGNSGSSIALESYLSNTLD